MGSGISHVIKPTIVEVGKRKQSQTITATNTKSAVLSGSVREQLERACGLCDRGHLVEARSIAQRILNDLENLNKSEQTISISLAKAFATALVKRGLTSKGALYSRDTSHWQLELFQSAMEKLVILEAYSGVVAAAIAREIFSEEKATLVDIGIGEGGQESALFTMLSFIKSHSSVPMKLEKLRIVGIDLTKEELTVAQNSILSNASLILGNKITVTFEGHACRAEDCDETFWNSLRGEDGNNGRIIVLGSLALHHTDPLGRDKLFSRIVSSHGLHPDCFVLGEPHLNHASPVLAERFRTSWRHFSLVWGLIEKTIPLSTNGDDDEWRRPVMLFFSREIEDAFANAESERTEREELLPSWMKRLLRVSLIPAGPSLLGLIASLAEETIHRKLESSGLSLTLHNMDSLPVISEYGKMVSPSSVPIPIVEQQETSNSSNDTDGNESVADIGGGRKMALREDQSAYIGIDFNGDTILGVIVSYPMLASSAVTEATAFTEDSASI